jgi:hypothetical protein
MSIDVVTVRRLSKLSEAEEVPVEFQPEFEDVGTLIWNKINESLRNSLRNSGFPQPSMDSLWQRYEERGKPSLIVVAQGIAVKAGEYEERFGSIDLKYYREHMSPEMFKAFVRHIGSIRGRTDLNVGEFVTSTEM